jgi:transcriptional regulator with XRE-family HTH domain
MRTKKYEKPQSPQQPQSLAQIVHELERTDDLAVERTKINVAETIYVAMRQGDVSKAELSRRLRKSRAYITQILQGDANFTVDSLVRIAAALHTRLEVKLVPNCASARWDHLVRNSGIQSAYPRWGYSGEYVPSEEAPQTVESNESFIVAAA